MRFLIILFISLVFSNTYAEEVQPLSAEQAFHLSVELNSSDQLLLKWTLAPDYYLYRDKIKISSGVGNQVDIGPVRLPKGHLKQLTERNELIYMGEQAIMVPLLQRDQTKLILTIAYQGCSSKGFCYSPMMKTLAVDLSKVKPPQDITSFLTVSAPVMQLADNVERDNVQVILSSKNIFIILLGFLGFGILLAFTPCVLPLIPVLSGIIIGHHKKNLPANKMFFLSLAYILGVATAYAIAGFVMAIIGSHIQAELQKPWIVMIFSAFFVVLALALFDVYTLRLPSRWQQVFHRWSDRLSAGTYVGAFLMGCVASLIVSPCVTPPLVGVLAYIAQTGDALLGAFALFAFGLGMGLPLLLIGMSAGKWLPKTGAWMVVVERLAGIIMLIFALWMLSRVFPGPFILFLWSLLVIGSALYLGLWVKMSNGRIKRAIVLPLLVYGVIAMIGALLGNANPLDPLRSAKMTPAFVDATSTANFTVINNLQQLDGLLAKAKSSKQLVLIDFYADWCESCIRIDRNVLNHPQVVPMLAQFMLLRVDVTKNTALDKTLMKRFRVIAPPSFVFMDEEGRELISEQMVGEVSAQVFAAHLSKIVKEETHRAETSNLSNATFNDGDDGSAEFVGKTNR